jgi:DNA-binding beta-propeller fold protein YncE
MSERGLAYDPETDTYFGGSWNDGLIYRFAADGTILDTVDARLAVAGLAYNPDTQHLFVMENFDPNLVHVLDVANDYADLGIFAIPGFAAFGGAGLELDCNGRLWAVQQMAGDVFQVESGESTSWCSVDLPWLAATPVSGTLASGQVTPLTVTIDTRTLAPGVHHGGLRISHDSPSLRPLDIDVTVRVEFAAPPKSLYMPLVAR